MTRTPVTSEQLAELIGIALTWVPSRYQEPAKEHLTALLARVDALEAREDWLTKQIDGCIEYALRLQHLANGAFLLGDLQEARRALRAGSPRGEEGGSASAEVPVAAASSPDGAPPADGWPFCELHGSAHTPGCPGCGEFARGLAEAAGPEGAPEETQA